MPGVTMETRQARMNVDLGGEQVVLDRMRCVETLGGGFTMEIDIVAALGEINLLPHLGKPIAIHVHEEEEHARHFHGLIVEGQLTSEFRGRYHYRLVAKPFTHQLAHSLDMAIFQTLSVPDIIKKILENAAISDFRFNLQGSYPTRDYCVQYRESDLTFITRLMEEEGIYYHWEHEAARHVMVLCDAPSAHKAGNPAALTVNPLAGDAHWATAKTRGTTAKHFLEQLGEKVSSGSEALVTLRAFDFKKPERPLQASATETHRHAGGDREVYEYPARYIDESRGTTLSTKQLAGLRRHRQVYEGRTHAIGLACGTTLAVNKHPIERLNATYLITHTEHVVQNQAYLSDQHAKSGEEAKRDPTGLIFHAIPATTPFHLTHVTPKPVVHGLETAIVSGPDGEEIFTDEYGRVKVRFHWDRRGRDVSPGENSTCWIRVAQFGGLGNVILPRVNQEVMVDFLHGNPDEPIVMGWVFNQAQMPVYPLPANRSRHVWRSKSYPGGKSTTFEKAITLDTGSPGANEIRFEDKAGEEEVFVHSEKDLNTRARHDSTLQVGRNEVKLIGYDRTDEVKNDETTTIGKDQKLEVVGDQTELIKAKRTVEVKADDKLTVGLSQTITAGTTIDISAKTSITISCGPSKITISPDGIKIEGVMVEAKGTASAKLGSPMTTVEGAGMTTITGGIVKIN